MAFINPLTPLKNLKTGNYFYPLTNLNQIICTNNRLSIFLSEDNNNLLNLSNINSISNTNVAAFLLPYWQFRQWSLDSSTGTKTSFFEDYSFPIVDNDRTSNASYKILTTKNLTDADSRFVTLSTTQTISGSKTFSAFVNGTINAARYLENRGGSTVTINDAAWGHGQTGANGSTNRATVWHLRWLQSGLTYTPSGGSETTLTDCGDMVIWLSSSPTSNMLQANIAIDGLMYAMDGFKTTQWYRSIGNVGWYSLTHGGGWYMTDTTWLRSYNNKAIYSGSGIIRSDSGVWGNSVVINSNWLGFYNGVLGATRYGYVLANANRMYFRKENGVLDSVAFDFAGGKVYNTNEFVTASDRGFRLVHNNRGAFWHWNANSGLQWFYLMFTAAGSGLNGGWTGIRAFYANADTGYTYHTRAYSAVWNDYAEFRQGDTIEPGRVVIEQKNGIMTMAQERLAPGAKIVSDTYGFAIGETKECKTPIAVSGRVLVYPYRNKNEYLLGAAVCAAPGGTVDIMTREEIHEYPERIIGTVSEIPNYDIWHCGGDTQQGPREEVKVNGRIWVYVR